MKYGEITMNDVQNEVKIKIAENNKFAMKYAKNT